MITLKEIDAFVEKYGDDSLSISYGPAHIVFGDYNTNDSAVEFCVNRIIGCLSDLEEARKLPAFENFTPYKTARILVETWEFLEYMLSVPEDEREGY